MGYQPRWAKRREQRAARLARHGLEPRRPRKPSWPRKPDPAWFDTLKQWDVLESPSGDLRIVREVSRRDGSWTPRAGLMPGRTLWAVTLAIRTCSWTHRPYTVYMASDLKTQGWRHTGVNVGPQRTKLDRLLLKEIRDEGHARYLDCCDVRGLP